MFQPNFFVPEVPIDRGRQSSGYLENRSLRRLISVKLRTDGGIMTTILRFRRLELIDPIRFCDVIKNIQGLKVVTILFVVHCDSDAPTT